MQIMVGGCLAQKDRETVTDRAPYVDVVLGTHNVHRAADLLREAQDAGHSIVEILEETVAEDHDAFPSALPVRREVPWAGWVTIQIGCDNSCAFCIVPAVRGKEISRRFDDIVDEVRRAAAEGVTEVTLLGQNVNSYGRDLALATRQAGGDERVRPLFDQLLRAVGAVDGIHRVRYTSPHPKDLRPETIAAMAQTPAVCEHLHLPLQSGSDLVLAAMHRGYTAERYLERLAAARAAIDDLAVTTDIIVGFPGETDDDFERTLEVVAEASYDSAYTFIYSPRPGTEAAARVDAQVPVDVVAERFERLRIVVERCGLARHEARVGRIEEVLVEGPSRKDPAVLSGRTRQNKLVHFAAEPIRAGSYATVRVTGAAPHHLRGELVDVTRGAAHRTRLPLLVG
jgi:tRNA-2-methylthio-N6-dimethylallyladenosine synthase